MPPRSVYFFISKMKTFPGAVFLLSAMSFAFNSFSNSPHLFDIRGVNEQHLLCICAMLHLAIIELAQLGDGESFTESLMRPLAVSGLFLWTLVCPYLILFCGRFQWNGVFIPFYTIWFIQCLDFVCAIQYVRRIKKTL